MSTLRYGRRVSRRLMERHCGPYRPRPLRLRTRRQKLIHMVRCNGSSCKPWRKRTRNLYVYEHRVETGRAYGYPECCIRYFVFGHRQEPLWRVHGYVICPRCADDPIVRRLRI